MDRKKLAIFVIILTVIVGFLVMTFDKKTNKASTTNSSITTKSALDGLAQKLEIKPELRDSIYVDWIEDDNSVAPLTGQTFFMGTVNINGIGQYKQVTNIENVTFDTLQPIVSTSDTYFSSIGFTKNTTNTRKAGIDPAPYETAGYENDTMKCVIRLDEHTDPFGNFFCGKVDESQIALQKQMGNMLPYKVTKGGVASLRVQKIEGDYAIGTYSEAFTGYTWMAKRDGTTWKILWKSNDIAPCADMERLGIPKSIYGSCYTPEN